MSLLEQYVKEGKIFSPMDDFPMTDSQRLFKRFAHKFSGAYSSITGFDNWVTNILPRQVEKKSFVSPDGVQVFILILPRKLLTGRNNLSILNTPEAESILILED